MSRILTILRSEQKTEQKMKPYSEVSVYPLAVAEKSRFSKQEKEELLKVRWYLRYEFKNPATGRMERQPNIYNNINRIRDFDERRHQIILMKMELEEILKGGYNPYEGHGSDNDYTCEAALKFAMKIKETAINDVADYRSRMNAFIAWLEKQGLVGASISALKRKHIVTFLNEVLSKTSAKNRNNTKAVISSLFSVLVENEIIDQNFVLSIANEKASPERHRSYSAKRVDELFAWMNKNDPVLSLFVKVVSYNFMRPVEVVRVRVRDVDLREKTFAFKAKNKPVKYKRIPDVLIPELSKLDLSDPDNFLFTPSGPGPWEANEYSRRDYFTKQFGKVKQHFGLGENYTMYSFRHTFTTRAFNSLMKLTKNNETETIDKLMLITGHKTKEALWKYLREIDARLPEDWSGLIS